MCALVFQMAQMWLSCRQIRHILLLKFLRECSSRPQCRRALLAEAKLSWPMPPRMEARRRRRQACWRHCRLPRPRWNLRSSVGRRSSASCRRPTTSGRRPGRFSPSTATSCPTIRPPRIGRPCSDWARFFGLHFLAGLDGWSSKRSTGSPPVLRSRPTLPKASACRTCPRCCRTGCPKRYHWWGRWGIVARQCPISREWCNWLSDTHPRLGHSFWKYHKDKVLFWGKVKLIFLSIFSLSSSKQPNQIKGDAWDEE